MLKDDLARAFITTQSFKWDPAAGFKLASGITSPYYVDCRVLMAHPAPRHLVAQLAFAQIKDLALNCVGGLEIGAISLATAISDYGYGATPRREWRTFVVRKQPKDHGLGKIIDGAVKPGGRALIGDDVLTTGRSVILAVKVARGPGLAGAHALGSVARERQEGRASVEKLDVTLVSL